jgi:hypothetical protein
VVGVNEYFGRYEAAVQAGRTHVRSLDSLESPPYVRSAGAISDLDFRVPRERAAEFAERFHTLVEEFNSHPNTTEGDIVHANLLAMFYATEADEAPGLAGPLRPRRRESAECATRRCPRTRGRGARR